MCNRSHGGCVFVFVFATDQSQHSPETLFLSVILQCRFFFFLFSVHSCSEVHYPPFSSWIRRRRYITVSQRLEIKEKQCHFLFGCVKGRRVSLVLQNDSISSGMNKSSAATMKRCFILCWVHRSVLQEFSLSQHKDFVQGNASRAPWQKWQNTATLFQRFALIAIIDFTSADL